MYSIYDYYKNDLDERYTAGKEKGTQAETGTVGRNVNPFTPEATQPMQSLSTPEVGTEIPAGSLYGDSNNDGLDTGQTRDRDDIWGKDFDWSQYPSPPIFDILENYVMEPAFTYGLGIAGGAIGGPLGAKSGYAGAKIGFDYLHHARSVEEGKTTEPFDWKKSFTTNMANSFIPGIKTGNPIIDRLANYTKSSLTNKGIDKLFGFLTGNISQDDNPYKGQRGWLEKGWDSFTGKYSPNDRTIGNPVTDPFLAVGPDTESDNVTNMLGDPNTDPFGATPQDSGNMDWGSGPWDWGGGYADM